MKLQLQLPTYVLIWLLFWGRGCLVSRVVMRQLLISEGSVSELLCKSAVFWFYSCLRVEILSVKWLWHFGSRTLETIVVILWIFVCCDTAVTIAVAPCSLVVQTGQSRWLILRYVLLCNGTQYCLFAGQCSHKTTITISERCDYLVKAFVWLHCHNQRHMLNGKHPL